VSAAVCEFPCGVKKGGSRTSARVLIKGHVSECCSLWVSLWCEERWFEDIGQSVDQRACE